MASGNTDTSGLNKVAAWIKISKAVDLFWCPKAGLWMFDIVVWVSGVVVLDDKVEEIFPVRISVYCWVAGINTNLAAWMKCSCDTIRQNESS